MWNARVVAVAKALLKNWAFFPLTVDFPSLKVLMSRFSGIILGIS